ncbi:MAG: M48 family metalloprotease, partial [Rhodocyclaceae bacterium]|nr:M48 family metalloprotease [Rhodocyclaceae bacterium]
MRALTRRLWSALLLAATLGTGLAPAARAEDGVNVDKPSAFRNLVPREALEQSAAEQYQQLKRNAAAKHVLVADGDAQVQRLRIIADRIVPHVDRFNAHARDWKWEVNLINSRQINAFCMPGGKIAFYTGLLQTLRLSD